MSLARGKFGIEYDPRKLEPESSGFGWVVVIVAFAALISLTFVVVKRIRGDESIPVPQEMTAETRPSAGGHRETKAAATNEDVSVSFHDAAAFAHRPLKLRNLLMRLEEAEKRGDVEMAVGTIESIRSLPGSPAADLDDALARRLGTLNIRRLFGLRCAQWVKTVEVRRGDSASRIATENGSTLASLARLNGGNVDRIILGSKLYVMDHPRFNLVLHRRTRIADLSLNGKFFKRYDLQGSVRIRDGAYEIPERRRGFWDAFSPVFQKGDRLELDMLLPTGASILVSAL